MINEKVCFNRFKRIQKKIENEGYIEWEKYVQDEIKDYDEKQMKNLIKRYEIKLGYLREENKERGMEKIITFFAPILLTAITLFVSIGSMVVSSYVSVVGSIADLNIDNKQYLTVMTEYLQANLSTLSLFALKFIATYVILIGIAYLYIEYQHNKKIMQQLYYTEIINVFKKIA